MVSDHRLLKKPQNAIAPAQATGYKLNIDRVSKITSLAPESVNTPVLIETSSSFLRKSTRSGSIVMMTSDDISFRIISDIFSAMADDINRFIEISSCSSGFFLFAHAVNPAA